MLLDFEKPIIELEEKLRAMQLLVAEKKQPSLQKSVERLEKTIFLLKERTFSQLTRWQKIQLSRHPDRPYTLDYIGGMTDSFFELHGDRLFGDDPAMIGGIASMGKHRFLIIGQQKGRNIKERQFRRFGMPNPEGYRKARRLMEFAEKFGRPIVFLIDTPGAYPGIEAEERGQAEAIAQNIQRLFTIKVPIVVVVIGEGASGGALAIGVGDAVAMLEHAWYTVISPEACATILWKNRDYKEQAADILKPTAQDMLSFGLIDKVIQEPLGGAHRDHEQAIQAVKEYIISSLDRLSLEPIDCLLEKRFLRFRRIGAIRVHEDISI